MDLRLESNRELFSVRYRLCSWTERERERERQADRQTDRWCTNLYTGKRSSA